MDYMAAQGLWVMGHRRGSVMRYQNVRKAARYMIELKSSCLMGCCCQVKEMVLQFGYCHFRYFIDLKLMEGKETCVV
jgi:hypothetical protein